MNKSILIALVSLPFSLFAQDRCGTPNRATRLFLFGPSETREPSDCTSSYTNPLPLYDEGGLYVINVVVHIIMDDSGTQGVVDDAMVQSQIKILNEDYKAILGTNGAEGTNVQIHFKLASEDPDGNPTTGITRDQNTTWFHDSGQYYNTLAWDPSIYMNIYTNDAQGLLGYVPFLPMDNGGGLVGSPADRVVILWEAFGRGAPIGSPYDQGRTATHEVGHFLGLEHTFSGGCQAPDKPDCYSTGDLICDTNPESSDSYGCPVGQISCDNEDPIHNYMDYTDDLCMKEFTLEQSRRIRCALESYRPLLYSVNNLCQNSILDAANAWNGDQSDYDYNQNLVVDVLDIIFLLDQCGP